MPRPHRVRTLLLGLALASSAASAGCSNVAAAFGPSPFAARRAGDELLHSFAARFTNVRRDAKTDHARAELARAALVPSRVFGDTSVWTAAGERSRMLSFSGRFTGGRYTFEARPRVLAPAALTESRHEIALRHLGGSDWLWEMHVEQAVGHLRSADVPVIIRAFLSSTEGRDARVLRLGARLAFPRTATALGRAYTLDSLRTVHDADGATTVTAVATVHPERLRATFPHLARYVSRYNLPTTLRIAISDPAGVPWVEASTERGVLRVRVRTREGQLVPLHGEVRPMPDTLRMRVDGQTRLMMFDVGFDGLVADLVLRSQPTEYGMQLRFAHEPDWRLPPVVGHLVAAPLRRPFMDGGALFDLALRDGADGGQTLVVRDSRVVVRESAIVRWLGALGGSAIDDFAGVTEREQNRFVAELFAAVQADLRALPASEAGASTAR